MPTKLSRYCEGIMEAAWLAAIIVIPVFFNIYSSRIFEPDKIAILRSIALIAIGAWLVKILEEGGARWENLERKGSWFKSVFSIPLVAPATALAVVYLISTVLSVTPRISLFGSYQRLQGTYTTLSYLVIFAVMIGNLRRKSQVQRLITAVALASLPISIYGILQRNKIDPVPWGGNVSNRIAANMGNSIFVAAYLIMAVPLVAGRVVESLRSILREEKRLGSQIVRATLYIFILVLDIIAIIMSGSRGPFLGLFVGVVVFIILFTIYWRARWVTWLLLSVAVLGGTFLILLNIPKGPLESLRNLPWIGRFGHVFDTEERTSQVRILIWQGASQLMSFHDPLYYPDGSRDPYNAIRPLVGYGPEGMYVAYNQFYPPELGKIEKRNASPDRSHNETWDSLVTTGVLGLIAYLWLFGSVFYYGLKWIGIINTKRQSIIFIVLAILGAIVGAVGVTIWRGVAFSGVGLPFGILFVVLGYMTIYTLFVPYSKVNGINGNLDMPIMIMLLSAVAAHFVEINFGIAIVATRTHFWVYAALLLLVGFILPRQEAARAAREAASETAKTQDAALPKKVTTAKRRKAEHSRPTGFRGQSQWLRIAIISGGLLGIILMTLGYDFISNAGRVSSSLTILVNSMTRLPNKGNAISFGVLALILTTWVSSALILTAENSAAENQTSWWKAFAVTLAISAGVALLFWLIHAGNLAALASSAPANQTDLLRQASKLGGLLTLYYVFLILILLALGAVFPRDWPVRSRSSTAAAGWLVAPLTLVIISVLILFSNLRVIYADMTFKMAEPFANASQWPVATLLYKQALSLSPNEDHYYLFLGRSYLEQAKTVDNETDQETLVKQAESDLKVAQKINPLNTDHTANLGRLYSWWAGKTTDTATRLERGRTASGYYELATKLSPYNPTLWGEWAILQLDILKQPDAAYQTLLHAISLDDQYYFTQGLMGDYYLRIARSTTDSQAKADAYAETLKYYQRSIEVAVDREAASKLGRLVVLGNLYVEMANLDPKNIDKNDLQLALNAYLEALKLKPGTSDLWKIEETVARLYAQFRDKTDALAHATAAMKVVPTDQKDRIQKLIDQINAMP